MTYPCIPFSRDDQLLDALDNDQGAFIRKQNDTLPGYPRILLRNTEALVTFLKKEFYADDLDRLAPKLWMMSDQSSANISPLHRQLVKNRSILITEDPRLHLVWISSRIFIKPIPPYLMSHDFWVWYLLPSASNSPLGTHQQRVYERALGFLRTYYYLIQYPSDFQIAVEMHLLPQTVTWEQFCAFSSRFGEVSDVHVNQRYTYGELRLSRLNFYSKIYLRKQNYHRLCTQTQEYFAQFYAPLLFLFAIATVSLTAMQLEVQIQDSRPRQLVWLPILCHMISFTVLITGLTVLVTFASLWCMRQIREWSHAIKRRSILRVEDESMTKENIHKNLQRGRECV